MSFQWSSSCISPSICLSITFQKKKKKVCIVVRPDLFYFPFQSINDLSNSNSSVNASTYHFFEPIFSRNHNLLMTELQNAGRLTFEVDNNQTEVSQVSRVLKAGKAMIFLDRHLDVFLSKIPNSYVLDGFITFEAYGFVMRKGWLRVRLRCIGQTAASLQM